jgi:hypothetical protein
MRNWATFVELDMFHTVVLVHKYYLIVRLAQHLTKGKVIKVVSKITLKRQHVSVLKEPSSGL